MDWIEEELQKIVGKHVFIKEHRAPAGSLLPSHKRHQPDAYRISRVYVKQVRGKEAEIVIDDPKDERYLNTYVVNGTDFITTPDSIYKTIPNPLYFRTEEDYGLLNSPLGVWIKPKKK